MSEKSLYEAWAEGSHVDMRGRTPETASSVDEAELWHAADRSGLTPAISWGDGRLSRQNSLKKLLEDPPADFIDELSRRDPKVAEELAEQKSEAVALEFRRTNPSYLKTEKNSHLLIQTLSRKYLKVDHLSDGEAITRLFTAGHFTKENLESTFRSLMKQGVLEVQGGVAKEPTTDEKNRVIATLRTGDIQQAVVQYLSYSLGGELPQGRNPAEFLSKHPDLARRAAYFCWFHSQAGIVTAEVFREFEKKMLRGIAMPTIEIIDRAWTAYSLQNYERDEAERQKPPEPKPTTVEDMDKWTDEQIAEAMATYRKGLHHK